MSQVELTGIAPSKVDQLRAILARVETAGARANWRYHAMMGTGVCVGEDAAYWFKGGKACPTILALTRDVPEEAADGFLWRTNTTREPWAALVRLLREMTEDEVREAMLEAAA